MSVALAAVRIAKTASTTAVAAFEARDLPIVRGTRIAAQARAIQRLARAVTETFDVDLRVRGEIPFGPALFVANHLSYLDPILLGALVPAIPLAKREIASWPIVGARLSELGVIFVDRDDPVRRAVALRKVRRVLERRVSVLNFPEGTTTRGDRVLPFREGSFGIAASLGTPIVPVRIDYPDRDLCWVDDETFVPHFVSFARRPKASASITFLPPLSIAAGEPAHAIAARARADLAARALS